MKKFVTLQTAMWATLLLMSTSLHAQYLLVSSGQITEIGTEVVVTNTYWQAGASWMQYPLDLNYDFSIEYQVFFGASDAGADGMVLVLHQDIRGLSAIGESGSSLGFAGNTKITPSVGLEFDTHKSSSDFKDPDYDHIAVDLNGNPKHSSSPNKIKQNLTNIEDNKWHQVIIRFTANNTTLKLYVDDATTAVVSYKLANNQFNLAKGVWIGWTGGTGALMNVQKFTEMSFFTDDPEHPRNLNLPVEMLSFEATALPNGTVALNWETSMELNNLGFEVQRGTDADNLQPLHFVPGLNAPGHYSWTDPQPQPGVTMYYRLRQVDTDGHATLSGLRSVQLPVATTVQAYYSPTANELHWQGLPATTTLSMEVLDPTGHSVAYASNACSYSLDLPLPTLAHGIYTLRYEVDGQWASQKILVP